MKSKNRIQHLFCSKPNNVLPQLVAVHTLSRESGTTKLLTWELYSASQPQAAIPLNCVRQQLCFISVYFVHLLARYVFR